MFTNIIDENRFEFTQGIVKKGIQVSTGKMVKMKKKKKAKNKKNSLLGTQKLLI